MKSGWICQIHPEGSWFGPFDNDTLLCDWLKSKDGGIDAWDVVELTAPEDSKGSGPTVKPGNCPTCTCPACTRARKERSHEPA